MNHFKANLKYLRSVFSIGQEPLARHLGKSRNTISNWQTGVSEPNIEELITLSKVFDVRLDILVMVNIEEEDLISATHIKEFEKRGNLQKNPIEYETTDMPPTLSNEPDTPYLKAVLNTLQNLNESVGKLRVEVKKNLR